MPDVLAERLEMLLVVRWIDQGREPEGGVRLSVTEAVDELGLEDPRRGVIAVMGALGDLEDLGRIRVEWPEGTGMPAAVTLSGDLRREARATFGA